MLFLFICFLVYVNDENHDFWHILIKSVLWYLGVILGLMILVFGFAFIMASLN